MKLSINLNKNSYDVLIEEGLYQNISKYLDDLNKSQKFILCYPSNLNGYANTIVKELNDKNYNIVKLEVKDGEKHKSINYIKEIVNELIVLNCQKDSILLGLGGGTIGDIVGFVSSIYMRGISYINIPTTLLSMVDSSMGGKTGVNFNEFKNMLGTFCQPKKVLIDPLFLKTLESKHLISGIGEIVKYGLISDKSILDDIHSNYNCIMQLDKLSLLKKIIYKSCMIKKEFIEKDEFDRGYRNILNFGHTLGHLIESKYQHKKITHGESVLIGINLSLKLSKNKKIMSNKIFDLIMDLFSIFKLNKNYKLNQSDLGKIIYDKKSNSKSMRFILLENYEKPVICDDISIIDLKKII